MRLIVFFISLFLICCQPSTKEGDLVGKEEVNQTDPLEKKEEAKKVAKRNKWKKKATPKLETKIKRATVTSTYADTASYITKDYDSLHEEAITFCRKNGFHKGYYFLLDYSLPSGKNRFFIYDFEKKKVVRAKLVTHGACDVFTPNYSMWDSAVFSDRPNSHCSSKGKYKIGKRDYSGWGINVKYWIKGLEDSNKSAEKRIVVLHSWGLVSDEEIYPEYSPLSWGCPAVSNNFMRELDERLQRTRKPVLLWIVD